MTALSQTILSHYQIRKSKKQKEAFRTWLCGVLEDLGYSCTVESGNFSRNVVVGNPETAKVIFTAHYDTCAVLPFPNFITPRNLWMYLLYQLVILIPIFALPFLAEIIVLLVWENCPMWFAIGLVYAVLIFELWWIYAGKANRHTANDNTSGVLTLVELAQVLPVQLRERVCFIFFDNEEKGLLGASAFAGKHKQVKNSGLVVNFDCVSDGDYIQFYPSKALKKEKASLSALDAAFQSTASKTVEVVLSFGFYPSDQSQFKRGVGVCALKKNTILGYYMDRIHTNKDTVLMEENIRLLRDGSIQLAKLLTEQ